MSVAAAKVKRYWPGKAPEWADVVDEDIDIWISRQAVLDQSFPSKEDTDVARKDDRRLRRLADSRADNLEEVRAAHRLIRLAESVRTTIEENRRQEGLDMEEADDDVLGERRRKIREKLLRRELELEEPALLPGEVEEAEEEESEYETDFEEELTVAAMVKPAFVPKSERDTIAERERLEAEELALKELVKQRLEERRMETKRIVVEEIRKDEEILNHMKLEENTACVDTDDEVNEADEYEAWKVRELSRIKRDREDREAMRKERLEVERVRNMTEEERREWEGKNPKSVPQPKQKWRFMQKYYHKGAFFQLDSDGRAATAGSESDSIYIRDFSAPTGEDKMDKKILPKGMQVKHFGRRGGTKWTHLVNEDTTDWNNPWTKNNSLIAKYIAKMAGMKAPITKPRGNKKLKAWCIPTEAAKSSNTCRFDLMICKIC